jgi:hypothetical protein
MNIYTDICMSGQEIKRVQLTVDPAVEVYRFQDYIFQNHDIDPYTYQLLHKGEKLAPDCTVGYYLGNKENDIHFTIKEKNSKTPCIYRSPCAK